jgi:O-antigen/teichoic acid export membrane protein
MMRKKAQTGYAKRFLKTAGVYFLGNVLTKITSFLLLPLYTSYISPDAYGVYGLSTTIMNTMVPVFFFTIWDGVFRFAFDAEDCDRQSVFANGFIVMGAGAVLYTLGFSLFRTFVVFEHSALILCYSLSMALQYFYTMLARGTHNNTLFSVSGCIGSIFSLGLNVVLILRFHMGVESLYISYIVGVILQIIMIEAKIRFLSHFSLKQADIKLTIVMLRFSLPIAISSASNWLLNGLTQVAITSRLGAYSNGLYTVAMKFSSLMILVVSVFQFAWYELAYDLANKENRKAYYRRSISIILKLSFAGLSMVLLAIKLVFPFFINEQYSQSLQIVPLLLTGTTINAYAGFLGTLFLAEKRSLSLSITALVAGAVNVVGLLIFMPAGGLIGATLSLCLAFIAYVGMRLIFLYGKHGIAPESESYFGILILLGSGGIFYLCSSSWITVFGLIILVLLNWLFLKKDIYSFMK